MHGQYTVGPPNLDVHAACHHILELVLTFVVLQRQGLTLVYVQHFAEVAIGHRPAKLITPWFVHA